MESEKAFKVKTCKAQKPARHFQSALQVFQSALQVFIINKQNKYS